MWNRSADSKSDVVLVWPRSPDRDEEPVNKDLTFQKILFGKKRVVGSKRKIDFLYGKEVSYDTVNLHVKKLTSCSTHIFLSKIKRNIVI